MKTFVCDYHLDDPTTFLHHQIQVCSAQTRKLALGYKNAFSVHHVHGLVIFQIRAQIQKSARCVYENWNVLIDYATAVIAIDFGKPKTVIFIGSTSFDHVIDVIADDACMLFLW